MNVGISKLKILISNDFNTNPTLSGSGFETRPEPTVLWIQPAILEFWTQGRSMIWIRKRILP